MKEDIPKLPASVYEAFVAAGIFPTAVVITKEDGEDELYEVDGHPFVEAEIQVADLTLPHVTIQRIKSNVICGKYGCFKVP
jgi:hypothetical protein